MTGSDTTPAQSALDILLTLVENTRDTAPALDEWRGFATLIDAEGVLDPLDDNDRRHIVVALLVDLTYDGPDKLRRRADQVETGAWDETLHNSGDVAAALRRSADMADQK